MQRVCEDIVSRIEGQTGYARVGAVSIDGGRRRCTCEMHVDIGSVPELAGHFRQRPVVPAVVLLEAMIQMAATMTFASAHTASGARFDAHTVTRASFRAPLSAGELVCLDVAAASAGELRFEAKALLRNSQLVVATASFRARVITGGETEMRARRGI